jgi:hypothetical protein
MNATVPARAPTASTEPSHAGAGSRPKSACKDQAQPARGPTVSGEGAGRGHGARTSDLCAEGALHRRVRRCARDGAQELGCLLELPRSPARRYQRKERVRRGKVEVPSSIGL